MSDSRTHVQRLVLAALLSACRATEPLGPSPETPGVPVQGIRIEARVVDGDGATRWLDNRLASQSVDSNGVIHVRFDNGATRDSLQRGLEDLTRFESGDLALSQSSIAETLAVLQRASQLSQYTLEVRALRITVENARSQLVIPHWTEGAAPATEARDIAALIDRLQGKAEEAIGKAETGASGIQLLQDPGVEPSTDADREKMAESKEAEQNLETIRRSLLAFLPDVYIALDRTGVERGDLLDLELEFRRRAGTPPGGRGPGSGSTGVATNPAGNGSGGGNDGNNGGNGNGAGPGSGDPGTPSPPDSDELAGLVTYHMRVDDLGWKAHVRPQLMFYRSTSGTSAERSYKLNAAGLVEWAYRYAAPDTRWERFVNGWEPAFGLHVASLDQGDSSVEVGLGINLSLGDGLISTGWGYNLSERDHYTFVGGDLFKLFDKIKDLAK